MYSLMQPTKDHTVTTAARKCGLLLRIGTKQRDPYITIPSSTTILCISQLSSAHWHGKPEYSTRTTLIKSVRYATTPSNLMLSNEPETIATAPKSSIPALTRCGEG